MPFITTFREAEINAACHMQGLGFADARATPTGPDGGIDVRSKRAIAQVKWQASQVGRPALQRLIGARAHRTELTTIFYTGSSYSRHAVEYANQMGIALFTYDQAGSMYWHNHAAEQLVRRAQEAAQAAQREADAKAKVAAQQEALRKAEHARLLREAERKRKEREKRRRRKQNSGEIFVINPSGPVYDDNRASNVVPADGGSVFRRLKTAFVDHVRREL